MWRLFFLSILIASLSLNIYFLLPVKEPTLFKQIFSNFNGNTANSSQIKQLNNTKSLASDLPDSLSTSTPWSPSNEQIINIETKIKKAINAQQYYQAANFLYELPVDDKKLFNRIKSYWLNNATPLLKTKQYELVEQTIDAFLGFSPDDIDFLTLVIKLTLAKQQILAAVKKAFNLQYHLFDLNLQQQSIDYAHTLVHQEIKRLHQLALWLELAKFAEEVLAIVPNNAAVQWALAQAQFQQGQYHLALESVNWLLDNPNYQVQASALLNNIQLALQQPVMIPLTRQGDHFIVTGIINNNRAVNLLIDTGASISLLSQRFFDELLSYTQVNYVDDIVLITAGGEVTSSIYQVEGFELQGYRVKNLKFAVTPFMNQGSDGLLGMNFLRLFDFHIDQTNSLLRLESKP